jgi:catechol 2,3-dioxygenase-like lactoylglutathione lyase family enzyme
VNKLMGPDFIALQVRDLDLSKRFYTEHLNLAGC